VVMPEKMSYRFQIEIEREADGRWIAEIPNLPGVLVYGKTKQEAVRSVRALALRVLAITPTNWVWIAQACAAADGCATKTRNEATNYRIDPASVSTNTSCSRPRSRAEGVRIVLRPMKIFSLRVIARRTSFSLTKT
jgi:hypothetical protein